MINNLFEFFQIILEKVMTAAVIVICIAGVIFWLKKRLSRMEIEFARDSNKGGRDENQDHCDNWPTDSKRDRYCFVLADGLGGHRGGKTASKLAVESILDYADKITENTVNEELPNALLDAHNRIQEKAKSDRLLEDMKTTCVVLMIFGNRAYWSTIGDSRIYIFRNGKILHKSKDHSVVQILRDMNEISEEEIRNHPDRNRVLKTLGMDDDFEAKVISEELKSGDHILLCTDGLWEYFLDRELEKFFAEHQNMSVKQKLNKLFKIAIRKAEQDNEKYDNLTAQLMMVK